MTARRSLCLLAQGMPKSDLLKLSVFLRLGRERLGNDWSLASEGAAHVVVVGADTPRPVLGLPDSPLAVVVVVNPTDTAPDGGGHVLRRPLEYEALLDMLRSIETRFVAPPVASTVASLATSPTTREARERTALPPGPVSAYRLRRWPSAELLGRHRNHLRLASILSARFLSLGELRQFSGLGQAECEAFITDLLAAGVLDTQAAQATATVAPPAATPHPTPAAANRGSLFARLRARLGIGQTPP